MTDTGDFLIESLKAEIERLNLQLDAAKRSAQQARMLHVLDTANRYARWLVENGAGSSYSTFCDGFGYQAKEGEDRPWLFSEIDDVITEASRNSIRSK